MKLRRRHRPTRKELLAEIASLKATLAEMERAYDEEHHGMGVEGSDFHIYGGTYHDRAGKPHE